MTITSQQYSVNVEADFLPDNLSLTPPNPAGFTVYQWVVVSNLTPFVATLSGVSDDQQNQPVLQPFTGDKYKYTNVRGPIGVTFSEITAPTSVPSTAPYITVQFSDVADGSDFPGIYPISYTAQAIAAEITGTIVSEAAPAGAISPFVTPLPVPSGTRTLIIEIGNSGALNVSNLSVVGSRSGREYYGKAPYYLPTTNSAYAYVMVNGVIDPEYTITATATGVGATFISVWGDSSQYDDSAYYNGDVKSVAVTAPGTILNGPARILSCELLSSSGAAEITWGGTSGNSAIIRLASGQDSLSFPPNTILPKGASIVCDGTISEASVTYAYP